MSLCKTYSDADVSKMGGEMSDEPFVNYTCCRCDTTVMNKKNDRALCKQYQDEYQQNKSLYKRMTIIGWLSTLLTFHMVFAIIGIVKYLYFFLDIDTTTELVKLVSILSIWFFFSVWMIWGVIGTQRLYLQFMRVCSNRYNKEQIDQFSKMYFKNI